MPGEVPSRRRFTAVLIVALSLLFWLYAAEFLSTASPSDTIIAPNNEPAAVLVAEPLEPSLSRLKQHKEAASRPAPPPRGGSQGASTTVPPASPSRVEEWAAARLKATTDAARSNLNFDFPDVPLELTRGISVIPQRFVGHPLRFFRQRAYRMEDATSSPSSFADPSSPAAPPPPPPRMVLHFNESLAAFVARCALTMLSTTQRHPMVVVIQDEEQCIQVQAAALTMIPQQNAISMWSKGTFLDDARYQSVDRRVHGMTGPWGSMPWRFLPHADYRARTVFGVLSTAQYLPDRLIPALNTWLCDVDAVLLFEEDPVSRALVETLLVNAPPPPRHGAWNLTTHIPPECMVNKRIVFEAPPYMDLYRSVNGAWKDFALLPHLYAQFPRKHWYAVVDDDSWILQENLNILLSTRYATTVMNPLANNVIVGMIFSVEQMDIFSTLFEFRRLWKAGGKPRGDPSSSSTSQRDPCGALPAFQLSMLSRPEEACQFRDEWARTSPRRRSYMRGYLLRDASFRSHCNDTMETMVRDRRKLYNEADARSESCRAYTHLLEKEVPRKLKSIAFPHGGAGMVISHAALRTLLEWLPACAALCQQSAGDARMGCCALMTNIELSNEFNFYSLQPDVIHTKLRSLTLYPVSFHNQRTAEMSVMARHTILSARVCLGRASAAAAVFANSPVTPWDRREHETRSTAWWNWTCTRWPAEMLEQIHAGIGNCSTAPQLPPSRLTNHAGETMSTPQQQQQQVVGQSLCGILIPYAALHAVYDNRTFRYIREWDV